MVRTHSVRVVKKKDQQVEQYVVFEEEDEPLLFALERKSVWLMNEISRLNAPAANDEVK